MDSPAFHTVATLSLAYENLELLHNLLNRLLLVPFISIEFVKAILVALCEGIHAFVTTQGNQKARLFQYPCGLRAVKAIGIGEPNRDKAAIFGEALLELIHIRGQELSIGLLILSGFAGAAPPSIYNLMQIPSMFANSTSPLFSISRIFAQVRCPLFASHNHFFIACEINEKRNKE